MARQPCLPAVVASGTNPPLDLAAARLHLAGEADGFSLRGWKGPPEAYFTAAIDAGHRRRLRGSILASDPSRASLAGASTGVVLAAVSRVRTWSGLPPDPGNDPRHAWTTLAARAETDLVLLERPPGSRWTVTGTAVCFPSAWSPAAKLGRTLSATHAPVPGLNDTLGDRIEALLDRLPHDTAWQRFNWGLTGSPELDQHPDHPRPPLTESTPLAATWWRVEHQALVRIDDNASVLFAIRVHQWPLDAVATHPGLGHLLAARLRAMPGEMRAYKGLAAADAIAARLDAASVKGSFAP